MMWTRRNQQQEEEDQASYDPHSNTDDRSEGSFSYDSSHASDDSSIPFVDRILDDVERRSGMRWYQVTVCLWAMTALVKNLGIGRHVHLDPPSKSADEASSLQRTSTRRAQENPNLLHIAVVRPFGPHDAELLLDSLARWDVVSPCGAGNSNHLQTTWSNNGNGYYEYGENYNAENMPVVDLVLSYSRTYGDVAGFDALRAVQERFEASKGWGCFSDLVSVSSDMNPEFDLYDPQPIQTNPMWVNGPNTQFRTLFGHMKTRNYGAMVLMEPDVQPQVNGWLDLLLSEVKRNQPFAVLGSKYDGHSWDSFRDEMPVALLNHLNGNAIYNTTHPLMGDIVSELEKEKDTYFNAIPYDYRISQMWTEGSQNIAPNFPFKQMIDESTGKPVVLRRKTKLFRSWYEKYGEEQPMKETHVLTNFGATNFLPQDVEGVPLVHGKGVYAPHEPKKQKITLVVSDWDMGYVEQLLGVLDHNSHPFTEILVMKDGLPSSVMSALFGDRGEEEEEEENKGSNVKSANVRFVERSAPDFMDICEAPVETEFFMMTNAYHKVAPDITIMLTPEDGTYGIPGRPLIPFTPSETEHCNDYAACVETLKLGREIYRDLDKIVLDFDMIYQTSARNDFCAFWKTAYGVNGAMTSKRGNAAALTNIPKGPTATSYMAYLYSIGVAENVYAFSDRTMHGNKDMFLKVLEEEEELHNWSHEKSSALVDRKPRNLRRCAQLGEPSKQCGAKGRNIARNCCKNEGLACESSTSFCVAEIQYNNYDRARRYAIEAPSFLVGK